MRGIRLAGLRTTLVAAILASTVPAHAADEETQLWLSATTVVPLAHDVTGTLELSPRFRESGTQFVTRASAEYRLTPRVSLGGGLAYVENAGGHEFRPDQQIVLAVGPLSFRSRVEERFFAGADRMQLRLRQRVQLARQVSPRVRLATAGELLYIARTEDRADEARIDSWRFAASAQYRFSKRLEAGLGYQFIYGPREGAPDRAIHVPQVTLTFRP